MCLLYNNSVLFCLIIVYGDICYFWKKEYVTHYDLYNWLTTTVKINYTASIIDQATKIFWNQKKKDLLVQFNKTLKRWLKLKKKMFLCSYKQVIIRKACLTHLRGVVEAAKRRDWHASYTCIVKTDPESKIMLSWLLVFTIISHRRKD